MQKNLFFLKKHSRYGRSQYKGQHNTETTWKTSDWKQLLNTKTKCQHCLLYKAYDSVFILIPWKPPQFEEILNIKVMIEISVWNLELFLSPFLSTRIVLNGTKWVIKAHCGLKTRLEILAIKLCPFSGCLVNTQAYSKKNPILLKWLRLKK